MTPRIASDSRRWIRAVGRTGIALLIGEAGTGKTDSSMPAAAVAARAPDPRRYLNIRR